MKIIVLIVVCLVGAAQASIPAPCSGPEYRQFDFWIGDWRVFKPDGSFAGMNRITVEYGGCVIHEHYTTGKGYSGESLNTYDAGRKVWHQTWVDDAGLLLTLEGKLDGKSMVLEGGGQRITWTPNDDGSVRQLWEAVDGKGKWSVIFDGKYTKR